MNIAKPIHAPGVQRTIRIVISPTTTIQTTAAATTTQLYFFHDLVLDDDEDLRTDIVTIDEQSGLDIFLKQDERLCVIKFYAPFCKACNIFRSKFRKLAFEVMQIIIDYKTFPSVITFRGGDDTSCSTTIEHGVR